MPGSREDQKSLVRDFPDTRRPLEREDWSALCGLRSEEYPLPTVEPGKDVAPKRPMPTP